MRNAYGAQSKERTKMKQKQRNKQNAKENVDKAKPTYENQMDKKETTTTIFLQAYSLYLHTHT